MSLAALTRQLSGLRLYREERRWTLVRPGLRVDVYRTPWGSVAVSGQVRNLTFGGQAALLPPHHDEYDGPKSSRRD